MRLPFRHPGIKRAEHTRVTQYDRIRENLTTENTENTERNQRVERPFREVDTKKIITFVAITETQMSVLCLPGYRCAIVLFCCLSFPSSVVSVFSVVKLLHLHKVLCQEHRRGRGQSGWLGSNQRFPAPEAGGLAIFPTPRGSAQRESNPQVRHGKARGCHYIMGTATVAELSKRPRAPGAGRTHVTALRERCLAC